MKLKYHLPSIMPLNGIPLLLEAFPELTWDTEVMMGYKKVPVVYIPIIQPFPIVKGAEYPDPYIDMQEEAVIIMHLYLEKKHYYMGYSRHLNALLVCNE